MIHRLVPKCPKRSLFTMISESLIVLSLLCLSVSGLASFKKCCPPGEVFSGMSQVNCVPVPPRSRELYIVNSGKENVTYGEFPMCENLQDITTVPLYEVNPDDFLQEPACIDILYIRDTDQSVPLFVYCKSNEDRENLHVHEQEAELVPKVLDLRRCCMNNTVFDVSTGRCEPPMVDVLNDNFTSLLPKELPFNFLNIQKGIPSCPEAIFTYEIDAENITYDNGNLKVELPGLEKNAVESFIVTDWNTCLELTPDFHLTRRLVVRVCRNVAFCREHGCIQKCCTEEEGNYDILCRKLHAPYMNFYAEISNVTGGPSSATEHGILVGLKCKHGKYRISSDSIYRITQQGYLHEQPQMEPFAYDNYCLDVFKAKQFEGLNAFICFEEKKTEEPVYTRTVITTILEGFSCFFLLLTLIVYACLPVLQNVHGKTLMCHSASLLVGYTGLATIPWVTPDKKLGGDEYETTFCAILGYIMLFSFLSAFSWLNVMCFDIWRTFGRLQGRNSGNSHGKRFLLYNVYAWGLSLSIALFGVLSDQLHILPKMMRPNFGSESCWFDDWYGQLLFFRGPVAIQLTANVVFFILTAEECSKVKAEISRVADPLDPRSKRFHANKTKFIMNVKLFVVMGMSWVAEIMSSFIKQYTSLKYQTELFYAADMVNCLQGVMIFFLFVAKRRVYQALKKRFCFDSKKKSGCSQGTSMLQDPFRVRKSASTGTLTSSFAVSGAP